MTCSTSSFWEYPTRYTRRRWRANRRTSRSSSLSLRRRPDANEASGRPARKEQTRSAVRAANVPRLTECPSKQATILPSACGSSVTSVLSRAETVVSGVRRAFLIPGGRKQVGTSRMGMNGIEFILPEWSVSQSELYRDIIKASGCEAAVEVPQSRNDHSHHWDLNVGTRLIEHKEIKALLPGDAHAGVHLLAHVETAELRARTQLHRWKVAWRQIGMVLQAQWRGAVKTLIPPDPTRHQADR